MNHRNFDDLKALIGIMTPGEISTAKRFLTAFDSNVTKNKNKGHALLAMVLNKPAVTIEKAKKKISPEVDDRSFDRQVLRLKDKLLESMLVDINLSKKDVYAEWEINRNETRKRMIQFYTLYSRNLRKEAIRLLNKVLEKSEEFELYSEWAESLAVKQRIDGIKAGPKVFEKYQQKINFARHCHFAAERAMDYYYHHFVYDVDPKGLKNDKIGRLTEYIADLQAEYEYSESAHVGRYLQILLSEYYLALEDYESAVNALKELITLVKDRPAIYSSKRVGFAYSDLADAELFRFNFDAVQDYAQQAQSYFIKGGFNHQIAEETEFRAVYYRGEFKSAYKIIDQLIAASEAEDSEFKTSKRKYLKACVLFMDKKYKEAYGLLQRINDIQSDKEGWNLGIRILSIQCLVELNKLDQADFHIEAMRKHIERHAGSIRERDQIILKILIQLEKESFDFKKVYTQKMDLLKQISTNETDLRWEINSPEMVVFQDWFEAKVNKKTYAFQLPDSAKVALENPRKAKKISAAKITVPVKRELIFEAD